MPIFLPRKTVKQVADRVGDNQRSEPPRPNKPSSEDHAKKDRTARPQKSLIDMVTSKKDRGKSIEEISMANHDFPNNRSKRSIMKPRIRHLTVQPIKLVGTPKTRVRFTIIAL